MSNEVLLGVLFILIICGLIYVFKPSKKQGSKGGKKSISSDKNEYIAFDKNIELSRIEAKRKAISVLHKFNIQYINKIIGGEKKPVALSLGQPDAVNDDDIILAFSRLSDENTEFKSDWTFAEGRAGENYATYIDGIIWCLVFAPEFVHQTVAHKDFINMWKKERERKIEMENIIRQINIKDFEENIMNRSREFILPFNIDGKEEEYVDLETFYQVFKEEYEDYIFKKLRIRFANPFNFYNMLAMNSGYAHDVELLQNTVPLTINNAPKLLVKKLL